VPEWVEATDNFEKTFSTEGLVLHIIFTFYGHLLALKNEPALPLLARVELIRICFSWEGQYRNTHFESSKKKSQYVWCEARLRF